MREIDFHFARFISGLCPHDDPDIFMGAALVSNAAGNGDIYLDLALSAGKPLGESLGAESRLRCPELNAWTEKLHASPVVGSPGELRPLILDKKNRLYLFRYWNYEKKLADLILKRAQEHIGVIDESLLRNSLQRLFPEVSDNGIDWQKVAALAAILKKFCLISGGPGTGKTFTVANILALLFEQAGDGRLEILLAAPTGKAAARLSESIRTAKKTLNCRKDIIDAIPSESYTIHRLLKTIPGSPYFIHNSENRLPADVLVVDEASMIDLALMSKLLEAIPATARLILIGDKDQLASVEAGSVLGDICDRNRVHGFSERFCKRLEKITGKEFNVGIEHDNLKNGLQDCIVVLKKSFRFTDSSTIGQLSRSVNRGDVEKVLDVLKTSPIPINWIETQGRKDLFQALAKKIIQGYAEYLKTTDPQTALERFNRFKILCAVNIGPFGVNAVNMLAEKALSREGLIQPEQDWYMGRPVLITRNDYNLGLFNGDMGLTLPAPDSDNKDLYVYFPGSSGQLRRFLPQRLPEHATVFAMTVHKSQGSEFDDVLLILPEKDYPVLTRELIYTAITRARQNISIWGIEGVVRAAVSRKIERTSGLRDALWAS
ncbi:MAG: exodeoxyribonuclease V subunit alpha, partial [Desulfobacterales bacterium]|nr:exodeoxyribonuclease V subunit alpha [Candidatus Desulfatibia vada]